MKKISKNLVAGILGLILMFGTTGYIYAEYNSGDYDYNPSICEMYGHDYSITDEDYEIILIGMEVVEDENGKREFIPEYGLRLKYTEYTCMNCGDSYTE